MEFKDVIRGRRTDLNLTLDEVAELVGVSKATVSRWESGEIANVRRDKIALLSKALRISPAVLMGWTEPDFQKGTPANILQIRKRRVPLLGSIAAGIPIYAEEEHESYVTVDDDTKCDFALRVKGDSMIPRFLDGDVVFIREQPDVNDGQVAAVMIGDEATLKHVYHTHDGISLVSDNTDYKPIFVSGTDCEQLRVMGRAVAFLRNI